MRINSRRYGASVGGREGANDIRLHGRREQDDNGVN